MANEIFRVLQKIGIDGESTAETVVTTYSPNGTPHISTIGVRTFDKDKIKMDLYANTQTRTNIRNRRAATVNIVSDAVLLSKQALPEIFSRKIGPIDFKKSKNVNSPYLKQADAIIEIKVEKTVEKTISDKIGTSNIMETIASIKNIEIKNPYPHPFKRTELYLIESAVLATKAIESRKRGKIKLSNDYVEKIRTFKNNCEKIAPKSREFKTISKILNYFN